TLEERNRVNDQVEEVIEQQIELQRELRMRAKPHQKQGSVSDHVEQDERGLPRARCRGEVERPGVLAVPDRRPRGCDASTEVRLVVVHEVRGIEPADFLEDRSTNE